MAMVVRPPSTKYPVWEMFADTGAREASTNALTRLGLDKRARLPGKKAREKPGSRHGICHQ